MNSFSVDVLSNASATGSAVYWAGGRGLFDAVGTFSGASIQLQYLAADSSSWQNFTVMDSSGVFTAVALTAAGGFIFELPPGQIRAAITGSPTAMYARAARIIA